MTSRQAMHSLTLSARQNPRPLLLAKPRFGHWSDKLVSRRTDRLKTGKTKMLSSMRLGFDLLDSSAAQADEISVGGFYRANKFKNKIKRLVLARGWW